jgi:hypothetical protein
MVMPSALVLLGATVAAVPGGATNAASVDVCHTAAAL